MQRYVLLTLMLLHVYVRLFADGGGHGGTLEALPDDVDGHRGGVGHLLVEEAVVAELVKHYLIGGKVISEK